MKITLNTAQDIKNYTLADIKQTPKIKIKNKSYTVAVLDNSEVKVSKKQSKILKPIKSLFSFNIHKNKSDNWNSLTVPEQLEKIIQSKNPTKMEHLTSYMHEKGISHHQGTNRDVYIIHSESRGYKIPKEGSYWSGGEFNNNPDMRLNDIYKSKHFYGGKYSYLATHKTEQLDGIETPVFQLIKEAEPLGPREKIPHSTLRMMEKAGFVPFDVKPDNFVKIKNADGNYDYLPIDAKIIAKSRSNSFRSEGVFDLKNNNGRYKYYYNDQFVAWNK